MFDIQLSWKEFSTAVNNGSLQITYINKDSNYYLFSVREGIQLVCVIPNGNAEDFENNYKDESISLI